MNRLLKLFLLQTIVVAIVAVPVYLYLRSDYREFQIKKQMASQVPEGIGAVCGDGWYSGSTGRGTCSHHGGVKYWGSELQQIAHASWLGNNGFFFVILAAGLIGWYAYGAKAVRLKGADAEQVSTSDQLQRQCCTDSLAQGLRFCSVCGAELTGGTNTSTVSPAITYVLITATAFLTIGLTVLGFLYFRARRSVDVAVAPVVANSPTVSLTPTPSPTSTPTPKATATPTPEDDLETYLDPPTPLDEAARRAKEKTTPTPEPSVVASRERVVSSPTPSRIIYPESLVDASDVLSAGYTRSQDTRLYRFHLSQPARVKGSFSAHGNISVYIVGGYYSSNGAISSDTIDVALSPGTYEVVVSSREVVGFSLHLKAYYDQ